ncbi:yippee putative zinc-binding protein [Ancylostoma duodenale]|uniref:Yippee putative zinc-binding protein n=1 Tax=Ancylostoma duodenale TaxID=51022 RepID=A0A0C2DVF9_9BILA|nr:yippee putative zinc-binding protein [Ancylostoma duodenale]
MKVLESSNKDNQTQKTKTFQIYSFSHSKAVKAKHIYSIQCKFVNIGTGPAEERVLLTGLHAVADIYCQCCKTTLGWKYVSNANRFIDFQSFILMSSCRNEFFVHHPENV